MKIENEREENTKSKRIGKKKNCDDVDDDVIEEEAKEASQKVRRQNVNTQ